MARPMGKGRSRPDHDVAIGPQSRKSHRHLPRQALDPADLRTDGGASVDRDLWRGFWWRSDRRAGRIHGSRAVPAERASDSFRRKAQRIHPPEASKQRPKPAPNQASNPVNGSVDFPAGSLAADFVLVAAVADVVLGDVVLGVVVLVTVDCELETAGAGVEVAGAVVGAGVLPVWLLLW